MGMSASKFGTYSYFSKAFAFSISFCQTADNLCTLLDLIGPIRIHHVAVSKCLTMWHSYVVTVSNFYSARAQGINRCCTNMDRNQVSIQKDQFTEIERERQREPMMDKQF